MKSRIAAAIAALIALTALCGMVTGFAGRDDDAIASAELKSLILPDPYIEDAYGLRGFTVSPDGKNMYLGYLHELGPGPGHISRYDTATLEKTGDFVPFADPDIPISSSNCFPKGLAVDNRGFMFVGVTHADTEYCSIYCVGNNFVEISHIVEALGDVTGINGITTQKLSDRILLYVLTCYNKDTIRCYDVTDPRDMKLYDGFGDGGVVDYNKLTGSERDAGYIAVDLDGNVYITCLTDDSGPRKGSDVLKLSPDGKSIMKRAKIKEAYGISFAGDYLFVSTYDDDQSEVHVLDREDLSVVKTLKLTGNDYPLTGTGFGGNHIYVASQGSESPDDSGEIFRTAAELPITRDPRETEKMDPGDYEVPLPTEVPPDNADASDSPAASNTGKRSERSFPLFLVIAGVCILAAAGAIIAAFVSKQKKARN